jgi:CubicO group peptidase (beta-lactamase class C family)
MRYLPMTEPLRTTWQYCNLMWATLGHVLETVASKPLKQVLVERLWNPLGMNSTYFALANAQASSNPLAIPYYYDAVTDKYYQEPLLNAPRNRRRGNDDKLCLRLCKIHTHDDPRVCSPIKIYPCTTPPPSVF